MAIFYWIARQILLVHLLWCDVGALTKHSTKHSPSNIIILLFHHVLLSVLLNFVFVILYRETFANRLNYPYLSAIFNILLGCGSTPFVLSIGGFCRPLFYHIHLRCLLDLYRSMIRAWAIKKKRKIFTWCLKRDAGCNILARNTFGNYDKK